MSDHENCKCNECVTKPEKCMCNKCDGTYDYSIDTEHNYWNDKYDAFDCPRVYMAYYGRYDEALKALSHLPWGDDAPDLENIYSYEDIYDMLQRLKKKSSKIKQLRNMNNILNGHIKDLMDDRALLFELMDKYDVTCEDKNKIFDNLRG